MAEEKDLPLPQTDLPKPEEELSAESKSTNHFRGSTPNLASQGQALELENQNEVMNSKAILIIILLLFFYPIGVILMWFKTRWPKWVKILLTLPFILGIIGLVAGIFVLYQISSNDLADEKLPTNPEEPVACTQEAKLCPDGVTYVNREGPICEFAQCPIPEPEDENTLEKISPVPTDPVISIPSTEITTIPIP